MNENVKIAERLEALMRPDSYIWGNLERARKFTEILSALRSPSPAPGMYSEQDLYEYAEFLKAVDAETNYDMYLPDLIKDEKWGIAAWKAKQPPATNDAPTRTVLPDIIAKHFAHTCGMLCVEVGGQHGAYVAYEFPLAHGSPIGVSDVGMGEAITALAAQLAGKDKRLDAGGK